MKEQISAYFERLQRVIANLDMGEIEEAVEAIKEAYEREAAIYIFGNGGSAATASHYVGDFNKGISEKQIIRFEIIFQREPIYLIITNVIGYRCKFQLPYQEVEIPEM